MESHSDNSNCESEEKKQLHPLVVISFVVAAAVLVTSVAHLVTTLSFRDIVHDMQVEQWGLESRVDLLETRIDLRDLYTKPYVESFDDPPVLFDTSNKSICYLYTYSHLHTVERVIAAGYKDEEIEIWVYEYGHWSRDDAGVYADEVQAECSELFQDTGGVDAETDDSASPVNGTS